MLRLLKTGKKLFDFGSMLNGQCKNSRQNLWMKLSPDHVENEVLWMGSAGNDVWN